MSESEFLALADRYAVLVYVAGPETHYEMVWSTKDRNGYVLVVNPLNGVVITIKRALSRFGYPCQIHDAARKPGRGFENDVGVAKITSSMLERAVAAVGADLAEAKPVIDVLRTHEKAETRQRAWHYRWTLRYLHTSPDGKVVVKTRTIGKEADIRPPSEDLVAKADAIVKTDKGWDATLVLVERDGMMEAGEWGLAETPAA